MCSAEKLEGGNKLEGQPAGSHIPIVYRGSRVIAGFHFYHEQGEEEEEHGHGKADTIDSSVPHKHIAADKPIQVGDLSVKPLVTKSRYLGKDTFHCEFTFAITFFKSCNSQGFQSTIFWEIREQKTLCSDVIINCLSPRQHFSPRKIKIPQQQASDND